jgi:hypothetical protein
MQRNNYYQFRQTPRRYDIINAQRTQSSSEA